jgi:flagellar biosynthesis protein FlhB
MSASEASREDRQLPASERRLQQAREEGQVARSRDLVHLVVLGAMIALLLVVGPWLAQHALELVANGLRLDRASVFDSSRMLQRFAQTGISGGQVVLPVLAGMALLTGAATVVVGGWNLTGQVLEPKFSKLDPLAGLGRIFAWRHLADHGRVVLVTAGLLGVASWYVWSHVNELQTMGRMPLEQGVAFGFGWFATGLLMLLAIAAVSALADVPLQLFKHKSELRMTLEEAKQENKESEGDPHIKGERRRRARAMSRSRMLTAVPTADVIVVNPTHYAVALRYDEATMQAPRIVAMGVDNLALKIRELAATSRIPVLDAPPLARALYRHGQIDAEVPVALYTAVAQVLAYVTRLRTALRAPALPEIDVPAGLDPLGATA